MSKLQTADETQLYRVIRRIRPLYRTLLAAVEGELRQTGVSVALRGVLEYLYDAGAQTVPQVGRALDVKRQFIQRLIDEATAAGLVQLRANPAHQRSPLFDLTDRGRHVLAGIRTRERAVTRRVARGLAGADVAAAERVVNHLIEGFGAHNARRARTAR